jgi:hypothetical protein
MRLPLVVAVSMMFLLCRSRYEEEKSASGKVTPRPYNENDFRQTGMLAMLLMANRTKK